MNKSEIRNQNVPLLRLSHIHHTYIQGGNKLEILTGIELTLKPGEIVALTGPSGSGKSTLLHITGLLEKPSQGEILIDGMSCGRLSDLKRTEMRRHTLGFVYQFHHLLPEFSAEENIVLPQLIAGKSQKEAHTRARHLLESVGLLARASHRPAQLSGGEQQRIAIARALANNPRILLADEPTGNLDEHTAEFVFDLLLKLTRQYNLAALIATHNLALAHKMDRILTLHEGKLDTP